MDRPPRHGPGRHRILFSQLGPFAEHDVWLDATATGTAYLLDRPEPRVW
jgi:hypothetical protein